MLPFARLAVIGASAGALLGVTTWRSQSVKVADQDFDRRECPGPWLNIRGQSSVLVAGIISDVPEFHDCQRFVVDGRVSSRYGDLYAVFASYKLDTLDSVLAHANITAPGAAFMAAAEVVTMTGHYDALGIKPRFNCLYLSPDSNWNRAYMLSFGFEEKDCNEVRTDVTTGKRLNVRRVVLSGYSAEDYPPVARWGRDPSGRYYIGLKCGRGWCEVGLPEPSKEFTKATPAYNAADAKTHRVRDIPGWYDEQVLAVPNGAQPPNGVTVKPSTVVGIVRPEPSLGDKTVRSFGVWVPVATIELSEDLPTYTTRLNLMKGTNTVFIKTSTFMGQPVWRAKIENEMGTSREFSVSRWTHTGLKIPGAARWRWLANDETIWVRCPEGCCQVQPM